MKNFGKKTDIISNLKLKATYGLVGNDAIGDANDRFFYLDRVSMDKNLGNDFGESGGGNSSGITFNRFANTSITWEKRQKRILGLNLGYLMKWNFSLTCSENIEVAF